MKQQENLNREALYESIINSSDDAIISKTLDGIITSWNKGAEHIFGYTAEEILHKHISVLVPTSRMNEDRIILERIKAGETVDHYETERRRKDGTLIYISLTVSPIKNAAGEIIGASKIARDITEHKLRIENLVRIHKEIADYKYALDESCIIAITDQKGIINYVNDNFCKISKYSREELLGQDHRIINSGFHPKEFIRDLWTTIARGKIWKGELKNKAKDGTHYWVDTTIVPFLTQDEKPYQYVAIRSDITDRKNAEELNLKNKERYQQVVENILDGLVIKDLNGKIVFANCQFLQLFGINAADLEHMRPEAYIAEEYRLQMLEHEARNRISLELPITYEYEGVRKNGTRIWVEERVCHVKENGIITGLQYALRDITKQKNAEQERMKVITDIVQRNKDLEQFSYIISHNLRSPVANILGISSLMNEDSLTEEEKNYLMASLNESIQRLDNTIIDLNQVTQAKISSNEHNEQIRFSDLVADVTASINNVISDKGVVIKTDFSEVDEYTAVKSYMHSIFYNLINNSIKYRKPGIPLQCDIRSKLQETTLVLTFKDNGLGIDLTQAGDQIFEIYKRFHISAADGKGMGLFMVKTHVESLGGTITVESEVGIGTTFKIELPLSSYE
jgi:PAS domain S-box-containing protein